MPAEVPLSIIVAIASNGVIGKDNQLIWHLSDDLKRFKKLTTGHTIVMGRKTFESLPNGPLPNRHHVILTANCEYDAPEGCVVVHTVEEAIEACNSQTENFIIGGAAVYELFLPYVSKMYLTNIRQKFEGDAFFPRFNIEEWQQESLPEAIDEKSGLTYQYLNLTRK